MTTPQDVALIDARKGLEMFRQVRVPVLGIVENMSYFEGEDGKRVNLFGHGGGRKLASEAGVPLLGEIPIDPRVAECGDQGRADRSQVSRFRRGEGVSGAGGDRDRTIASNR